jgi:hypothetical protein
MILMQHVLGFPLIFSNVVDKHIPGCEMAFVFVAGERGEGAVPGATVGCVPAFHWEMRAGFFVLF